jgi:hypothetical protein
VADKSSQLVLSALSRTFTNPAGLPLHGGKATPGLFPNTAAGKQAAQRCLQDGFLRCASHPAEAPGEPASYEPTAGGLATTTSKKAKATPELYRITEKGTAWLLSQASPREVIEDFVRVLETRQTQMGDLLILVRQMQSSFEQLRANAEKVLQYVRQPGALSLFKNADESQPNYFWQPEASANGADRGDEAIDWPALVLDHLAKWQGGAASEDCPLPELYQQVNGWKPGMSIGRFHDALRQLVEANRIYLHPWTGPMYELPEPAFALLVGHEVAYYASYRKN